jgi:hypothetical protein
MRSAELVGWLCFLVVLSVVFLVRRLGSKRVLDNGYSGVYHRD